MDNYWELITSGNSVATYVIFAIVGISILGFIISRLMKKPPQTVSDFQQPKRKRDIRQELMNVKEQITSAVAEIEAKASGRLVEATAKTAEKVESILGTGQYKCLAIREGNIADFTTIPIPIGEMYFADPSCPDRGGMYIVRELPSGKVIDYDPRKVPLITKETPDYAWFATHWDIVNAVYSLPLPWWRSSSTWFAIGAFASMFIIGLAVLGG